jgi:gluconokinase
MSSPDRHVFVVYGPAGCGKTTIAQHIADHYSLEYIEGDNVSIRPMTLQMEHRLTTPQYHPPSNVDKMSQNIPLQDADRWDWLINLREAAVTALECGAPGVVMTCSALKKKYRDVIRIASINEHRVHVHFLCLQADRATLIQRVSNRENHFMGDKMVDSQLRDLEPIGSRETDVIPIDVRGTETENQRLADSAVEKYLS